MSMHQLTDITEIAKRLVVQVISSLHKTSAHPFTPGIHRQILLLSGPSKVERLIDVARLKSAEAVSLLLPVSRPRGGLAGPTFGQRRVEAEEA
jgi:hypothetical protein